MKQIKTILDTDQSSRRVGQILGKHNEHEEDVLKVEESNARITVRDLAIREAVMAKISNSATTERADASPESLREAQLTARGIGFFISTDGYVIANEHVVHGATEVRLLTAAGSSGARVVKVDAANDLALIKVEGKFKALSVVSSCSVKLGATVATVGFQNIGSQGFALKLAKGEIAALSGAGNDARYFQISLPVQPGNSGGAMVDERGNVVGVVSAKLNAQTAFQSTEALLESVNYAVKSSFVLGFLESVPELADKLKEPEAKERKFEDVVKSAEQAAVLVLVY